MGQDPMTRVSSSFCSLQRWWLEAGWQVVGCRGLGGEKEPPTGWDSTSAAHGRPRRRSQGINPVFASSYILPGAPFGGHYCDPCRAACRVSTGGEGWGRSGEVNRACAEQGDTGWEGGTGFIKNIAREVGNVCSALLDRHIVVRMIQWRPVEFGAPAWVRVKVLYSPVVLYLPCKWQRMGKANSILVTL